VPIHSHKRPSRCREVLVRPSSCPTKDRSHSQCCRPHGADIRYTSLRTSAVKVRQAARHVHASCTAKPLLSLHHPGMAHWGSGRRQPFLSALPRFREASTVRLVCGACAALCPGVSCSSGFSRGRSVVAPRLFHCMRGRVTPASLLQHWHVWVPSRAYEAPAVGDDAASHTADPFHHSIEAALASANHRERALLCSSVCRSPLCALVCECQSSSLDVRLRARRFEAAA